MENPVTSILNAPMIQKVLPTPFIEFLVYSSFNPVPYHRKIAGDFYYIYLRTLEGNDYHITANPKGYYINSSQTYHFNSQPSSKKLFINLLDLLRFVSPKFVENFDGYMNSFKVN